MILRRIAVGLILVVVAGVDTAPAQEVARTPSSGSTGLSFRIPEGGGAGFGLRRMLSARTNAGIDLVADLDWRDTSGPAGPQNDSQTSFRLDARPNLRLYRGAGEHVLPFLLVAVRGSYVNSPNDAWAWGTGGQVGVGAEWFPVRNVSVSGSTGIGLDYSHNSNGQGSSIELINIGAFRSALDLNIYF